MNSFGSIAGRGDRADYRWGATNADANTRAYSLMYHKVGGNPGEVVVNGNAAAGEFAGVNMTLPAEPISTTTVEDLSAISVRAKNLTLALRPARVNVWAAPSTTFAEGTKVIADGTNDRVKPMPAGSTAQVLGIVKEGKTTGADPELIQIELLAPGCFEGAQTISAFGTDAMVNNRWLVSGYSTIAAAASGLFVVPQDGIIKNLTGKLKVAAGGGKTITLTVFKSSDGGATFTATTLTVAVVDPATLASENTIRAAVSKGDILAIKITTADAGAAEGMSASFQYA